jgi:hypothetical protein
VVSTGRRGAAVIEIPDHEGLRSGTTEEDGSDD